MHQKNSSKKSSSNTKWHQSNKDFYVIYKLVTEQSFPNQTEQVNQKSVSRTETEQNWTCKKRIKT